MYQQPQQPIVQPVFIPQQSRSSCCFTFAKVCIYIGAFFSILGVFTGISFPGLLEGGLYGLGAYAIYHQHKKYLKYFVYGYMGYAIVGCLLMIIFAESIAEVAVEESHIGADFAREFHKSYNKEYYETDDHMRKIRNSLNSTDYNLEDADGSEYFYNGGKEIANATSVDSNGASTDSQSDNIDDINNNDTVSVENNNNDNEGTNYDYDIDEPVPPTPVPEDNVDYDDYDYNKDGEQIISDEDLKEFFKYCIIIGVCFALLFKSLFGLLYWNAYKTIVRWDNERDQQQNFIRQQQYGQPQQVQMQQFPAQPIVGQPVQGQQYQGYNQHQDEL